MFQIDTDVEDDEDESGDDCEMTAGLSEIDSGDEEEVEVIEIEDDDDEKTQGEGEEESEEEGEGVEEDEENDNRRPVMEYDEEVTDEEEVAEIRRQTPSRMEVIEEEEEEEEGEEEEEEGEEGEEVVSFLFDHLFVDQNFRFEKDANDSDQQATQEPVEMEFEEDCEVSQENRSQNQDRSMDIQELDPFALVL